MTTKIIHQLGHRYCWNFDSYQNDGVGDGFIIAPSHMERNYVERLSDEIKNTSFFDPQFFLPNTRVRKLPSYDFFPDVISSGFTTQEFTLRHANQCAVDCLIFQNSQDFEMQIIPTRHFTGLPLNFVEQQDQLFVQPFISGLQSIHSTKPVLLQLIINENMIKNEEYSNRLLNWITHIREITGVYLIADINPRRKQLVDIDFLYRYMKFIDALKNNDLFVMLGYLNIESLLLLLADPDAVTIGSYDNLRMFKIKDFEPKDNKPIRAPSPRIYSSQLLQLIQSNYLGAIQRVANGEFDIDDSKYKVSIFEPTFNWHFHQPILYKHFFLVFSEQLRIICALSGQERYNKINELINNSIHLNRLIEERGVTMDDDSNGSHLAPWQTVANLFSADKGWR